MLTFAATIACVARRLSRRDLEVFRLGTAMTGGQYSHGYGPTMDKRTLGQGLEVSAEGLGCMGMSAWYGETDHEEAVATIHRALDLGVFFLDTADMYGASFGENEQLV